MRTSILPVLLLLPVTYHEGRLHLSGEWVAEGMRILPGAQGTMVGGGRPRCG
ncbi:MAG: hypothetical protein AAFV53_31465 [Myxococcota bacterium]